MISLEYVCDSIVHLRTSRSWRASGQRAIMLGLLCVATLWMCHMPDTVAQYSSLLRELDQALTVIAAKTRVVTLRAGSRCVMPDVADAELASTKLSGATVPVMAAPTWSPSCRSASTEGRRVSAQSDSLGIGFGPQEFTAIPAGTFQMGAIAGDGFQDERPAHTVTITQSFLLQRTEVTQGQWTKLMGTTIEQGQRQVAACQQLFELHTALRTGARHDKTHTWTQGT